MALRSPLQHVPPNQQSPKAVPHHRKPPPRRQKQKQQPQQQQRSPTSPVDKQQRASWGSLSGVLGSVILESDTESERRARSASRRRAEFLLTANGTEVSSKGDPSDASTIERTVDDDGMLDIELTPSLCSIKNDYFFGNTDDQFPVRRLSSSSSASSSSDASALSASDVPEWAQSDSESGDDGTPNLERWTPSKGFVETANVGKLNLMAADQDNSNGRAGGAAGSFDAPGDSPVTRRLRLISKDGDREYSNALRNFRTRKANSTAITLPNRLPLGRSLQNIYQQLADGAYLTTRLWHIQMTGSSTDFHVVAIRHYSTVLELRVDGKLTSTLGHGFFHFFGASAKSESDTSTELQVPFELDRVAGRVVVSKGHSFAAPPEYICEFPVGTAWPMTLCGADSGGCAVPGEICGTPSANFTIPRFEICGSVEGERFVAYTVDVSLALPWRHEEAANDHKQENVRVTVTKRYSDFVRLHKLLRSVAQKDDVGKLRFPALPPKTSFGVRRFGQEFCETRRAALERYLRGLVELMPKVVLNPDLLEFLELL